MVLVLLLVKFLSPSLIIIIYLELIASIGVMFAAFNAGKKQTKIVDKNTITAGLI